MQKLLLFFLLMPVSCYLSAQPVVTNIHTYFKQIRQQPGIVSLASRSTYGKDAEQSLTALQSYQSDSLLTVRQEAYRLVHELTQQLTDQKIKTKGVAQLVQGVTDADPGIQRWVAQRLYRYEQPVFSINSRNTIEQTIRQRNAAFAELVLMAGYLELNDLLTYFTDLLKTSSADLTTEEKWNVHLAVARMGDPLFINYCVQKVKRFGINDDVVYALLPGLVYIRQPESFAFLQTLIFDDEKHCEAADMETGGKITCAYRVLELVTPYIEGFPLHLTAGGDLDVAQYPEALQTARTWFANQKTYALKRTLF